MLSLLDNVWVKTEGDFKVFYCLVVIARFFPPNLQFNVNFSRGVNILFVYKILHAENLERHINLGPTLKRKVPPSKRSDVLTVNRLTVVEDGQPLHFSSSYNSIAMCCLKDISRTV